MKTNPRIIMLGAAPGSRGSIAPIVETFRARALFKRWPIDYVATHGDGSLLREAGTALRAVRRLGGLIGRHRRVVVHAHVTARAGFWREGAFLALAAATRCPLIIQLHGGGFERFHDDASTPARALIRALLERAACVIVPCDSLRLWVHGVARNARVACMPIPIVPQNRAADRPGAAGRANMVLFLGRLEERKGVFELLEALAAMRAAVPDVRLVCAGEGDRAPVASYAQRLGIADAVKLTGWVGPSGKRALFENAAALVLPSFEEGLPVSLLEAMAAGVPVIAAAVGGIPEVVVDGVSGFLVAPGDKAAIARLMKKLLLEPALGDRIGAAARESVSLRFAPERALSRLEEIYADAGVSALLQEPGQGRGAAMREAV